MKIKKYIQWIGWLFSYTPIPWSVAFIENVLHHLYTGSLKRHFSQWGSDSVLRYKAKHLRGLKHITVGCNTVIEAGVQLTAWDMYGKETFMPEIIIGHNCIIRENAHITAISSIRIGNNLLTGTNVLITDNSHGTICEKQVELPPAQRPLHSKGPVRIGNNVWLGNNVCVMPGVTIGDGVVIGANSIVTHDIPAYSMAVGVPARVIKQTTGNPPVA